LVLVVKGHTCDREEIEKMSVKELKAFLHSRSIDTRSILEKGELVERAKAAIL
jgi:hypothetical protein